MIRAHAGRLFFDTHRVRGLCWQARLLHPSNPGAEVVLGWWSVSVWLQHPRGCRCADCEVLDDNLGSVWSDFPEDRLFDWYRRGKSQ